jgi:hypothetical protein
MSAVLPGLAKLTGGRKQAWINSNLDFIAALNDHLGFKETARVLNMKTETLSRALVKAEQGHRPAITQADKAMSRAQQADIKANKALQELHRQGEALNIHFGTDQQLREQLSQFFELQSRANSLMAQLVRSVPDLTYGLGSAPKTKVGLSKRKRSVRLSVFRGPRSLAQLPGPVKINSHRRYLRRRSRDG